MAIASVRLAGALPGTNTAAMVHFDGDGWSLHVNDLPGLIQSVAFENPEPERGDEGVTWIVANDQLWRWPFPFEPPEPVALPQGAGQAKAV
jgi:hypothetical protein